jgi:hypothetical protein
MKEQIEQMIQRHLPLPGLVVWIARLKDGTTINQRLAGRLATETIERGLSSIVLTAENLRGQNFSPETLSMVFEQARLRVAFRSDGSCLALFLQNSPETKAPAERLLDEFQRL